MKSGAKVSRDKNVSNTPTDTFADQKGLDRNSFWSSYVLNQFQWRSVSAVHKAIRNLR